MRTFFLIWAGQLVSLTGSRLTSFALGVWVFQETGSATQLGLVYLATMLPSIVISLPAGALADRWDRRRVMLVGDAGAGLSTLGIAALLLTSGLEVWHVYLLTALNATFSAFQAPAYTAAITLLVPKSMLGRTSGMMQFSRAGPSVVAPVVAGFVLAAFGLEGVLLIDFATFLLAFGTLLTARIPMPDTNRRERPGRDSFVRDAAYGLDYIAQRPGLLGIQVFFTVFNLLIGVVQVLVTPLVLSFASVEALGTVLSVAGVGMLLGSVVMSAWGGPRRRVLGIVGCAALAGLALAVFGTQPSVPLVAGAAFVTFFCRPIFDGSYQALTQAKVAPEVQGRVFALQLAASYATLPVGYLVAGPLADRVFEPLLTEGGALAGSAGRVIGVGAGRGIGLMFIIVGLLITLAAGVAYLHPRVRHADSELPDAVPDAPSAVAPASSDGAQVAPASPASP